MKNIVGLILLILIVLTSCEGRKSKKQSLAQSIAVFKKDTLIEQTKYIPDDYTEVVRDTILSNGFRVKIKYASDMNHQVLGNLATNKDMSKIYHREFNAKIEVSKNGKKVFNEIVDKKFILIRKAIPKDSLDLTIMSNLVINDDETTNDNLSLDIWFNEINTKKHKVYTVYFNTNKMYKIDDVKELEF